MFDYTNSHKPPIKNLSAELMDREGRYYFPAWDNTFRWIFTSYIFLVFLFGFFANLIAFLGSIFYNAIKSDKISVILLRDLAATDVLISVFFYVPMLVTLVNDGWVLGEAFCVLSHLVYEVLLLNKLLVIMITSIYRIWMLKKPPAVKNSLQTMPFVIILFILPFVCVLPFIVIQIVIEKSGTFFDPMRIVCYGRNFYDHEAGFSLLIISPFLIIPMIIIISTNVRLVTVLINQAKKTRRGFQRRRIFIAIKIIRLIIVLTYVPAIITMSIEYAYADGKLLKSKSKEVHYIYFIAPLNCAASPVIYVLSNRTFREFLLMKFCCCRMRKTGVKNHTVEDLTTAKAETSLTIRNPCAAVAK